jgi:uncharacterized membrane protein
MQPSLNRMARRLLKIIAVLASLGIGISSVSLYHHYGTESTSYCDFGQSFNCDLVNRSAYSDIFGIPVALIGILGYGAVLVFATIYRSKAETPGILLLASIGGLGFALYLAYIEAFILGVWCILCMSSLALIVSITILAAVLVIQSARKAHANNSGTGPFP